MIDGIINVNKPQGMTSHDVVGIMRRILRMKKIGHTGTLDPMATGVLPVCIGKATRIMDYLELDFKTYVCALRLGVTTDTQDIWGNVLQKCEAADLEQLTEDKVREAFEPFRGAIWQKPPMYSALKLDGRKLYEYARAGQAAQVEDRVKARQVYINSLDILEVDLSPEAEKRVVFRVECSKGTYIRTICQDVGLTLGCGAVMTSLERTAVGSFRIEDSVDLGWLKALAASDGEAAFEAAVGRILPVDYPLGRLGRVVVDEIAGKRFTEGWHLSMQDCRSVEEPVGNPPLQKELGVGQRYEKAYRVYLRKACFARENASIDAFAQENACGDIFAGVAIYSDQYKKLVADKVFYRNDGSMD